MYLIQLDRLRAPEGIVTYGAFETPQPAAKEAKFMIRALHVIAAMALAMIVVLGSVAEAQSVRQTGRTFRDWTEACEAGDQGQEVCFIFQRVSYKGKQVANITLGFKPGKRGPVAVINMPLGAVHLPDGLRVRTDQGVDGWGAFKFCDKRGCHVELDVEPQLLAAMQAGSNGWLLFYDLRREAIQLPFSLRGLTAGLQSLQR